MKELLLMIILKNIKTNEQYLDHFLMVTSLFLRCIIL